MQIGSIIFQGQVFSKTQMQQYKFPTGTRFHFSNGSYNDDFTVVGVKKNPGTEHRQLLGRIAGEVWMEVSTLQKEAVAGTITRILPPDAPSIPAPVSMPTHSPAVAKNKVKKVVKKTAKKKKKS